MSTFGASSPQTEAKRLASFSPPQARAMLNDRISRTFLQQTSNPQAFKQGLAYNAALCTELATTFPAIWK